VTLSAADGTQLVTRVSGAGAAVVFVHGSNGGLDSFADIVADLADDYQVWRYARRGYLPSGDALPDNTFDVEAADLAVIAAAAAHATGGPVHIVGASYGATVALYAALASPEHIASLALFEPPLLQCGPRLEPVVTMYANLCVAGDFSSALELFLRQGALIPDKVLAAGPPAPTDPAVAVPAATALRSDLEAMAADSSDIGRWSAIVVPVLLMGGAQSWPPLPEGMDLLAAALPHARQVVWEDQSHFATAAAPELVAGAIREFLADIDGAE
jgi:pimeloyl-ACP methyl ester carboxylesterase